MTLQHQFRLGPGQNGVLEGHDPGDGDTVIDLVDRTELNTVVIDIKNDEGQLTYRSDEGTTSREIGACVRYISDLPAKPTSAAAKAISVR